MMKMELELDIKRLSHVSISSDDLDRAELFYKGILGLKIVHNFINDKGERYGFFLLSGCGTFIEIFRSQNAITRQGRLRHICFEVADIEKCSVELRSNGIYDFDIKRGRTDRVLQLFIDGPDGVQIEFQQHDELSLLFEYVK